MLLFVILASFVLIGLTLAARFAQARSSQDRTLLVTLGSGGHTGEMLSILSTLDLKPFQRLAFYVSTGDHLSLRKAQELVQTLSVKRIHIRIVPRARRVKQSFWTSPLTSIISLCAAVVFIAQDKPDLILSNGPGTALILIAVARAYRLLGLQHARIIFVESFARVTRLSLSGKLLLRFGLVDRFLMQWQPEREMHPQIEYVGSVI